MTDPAEIRAEGRRLLALEADADSDGSRANVAGALYAHLLLHADVLLADPAPVGLTEDEVEVVRQARERFTDKTEMAWGEYLGVRLLAIIDRLSAAPVDDREREGEVLPDAPDGWRWVRGCCPEPTPCGGCGTSRGPYLAPVSPSVDPEEG